MAEHTDCGIKINEEDIIYVNSYDVWRLDDDVEIIRYKWKDGKLVESEREQMSASNLADD